jgi:hypothetical protein
VVSTSAPKGRGAGLDRAPGQAKGKRDPETKGNHDPSPTIPPAPEVPDPADADHVEKHPEKHAGKSDKNH